MGDADLQQAVREDLQWEPRVDGAHGAPSEGFLHIVVGYDGSAPAGRALDAAVGLLRGRAGCIAVVWVARWRWPAWPPCAGPSASRTRAGPGPAPGPAPSSCRGSPR